MHRGESTPWNAWSSSLNINTTTVGCKTNHNMWDQMQHGIVHLKVNDFKPYHTGHNEQYRVFDDAQMRFWFSNEIPVGKMSTPGLSKKNCYIGCFIKGPSLKCGQLPQPSINNNRFWHSSPMKRPSCAKHFLAAYGANWCPSHNFGSPIIICFSDFSELFFGGQEKGMGTSQKDTQPWNLIELDFYNEMPSDRKHTPPTFLKPLHPITAHGTSIMITPKRTSGDDSEDLIILLISTCWISSTYSPENKKNVFLDGWLP